MAKQDVRAAIADAEPVTIADSVAPEPDERGSGGNGGPPEWNPFEGPPGGCRVRPVGKHQQTCIFLDALGQLVTAGPRELGESYLTDYFAGDMSYISQYWPYYDKDGSWKRSNFNSGQLRRHMQMWCARKGIWDDMDRVRGRGAWRGPDGGLIYHCGDVLIDEAGVEPAGVKEGNVYPAGQSILRPAKPDKKLPDWEAGDAAAHEILGLMKTWNWSRGALDARLFFGSTIAAYLSGALHWRPSTWTIGDAACGKSTLQRLRRWCLAGWNLSTEDPSPAGIYQKLKFDAISVSFDEAESSKDNRKLLEVVKLARLAASGAVLLRGSSGHVPVSFSARNVFSFSSINPAPLRGQDMSRIPELQLFPLDKRQAEPEFTQTQCQSWGAELLRRALTNWHRFDETLAAYRDELKRLGHDSRGQDTFGTLLACADLVLSENGYLADAGAAADPDADEIWHRLEPIRMPEYFDRMPNYQSCADHLLSMRPREWPQGCKDTSIGGLCTRFLKAWESTGSTVDLDLDTYRERLAQAGCALLARPKSEGTWWLGISNRHPSLAQIFEDTDWPGITGAMGGWAKALKQGPPGEVASGNWPDGRELKFRVDGRQVRGVAIRLDKFISTQSDNLTPED